MKKAIKNSNSIFLKSVTPELVLGMFFLLCIVIAGFGMRDMLFREKSVSVAPIRTSQRQSTVQPQNIARPGQESDPKTHPQQYDLAGVEKAMSLKQKIQFPAVTKQVLADAETFPKFVQNLHLTDGVELQTSSLIYKNAKNGTKLLYTLRTSENYNGISNIFRGRVGASETASAWNEIYGFVEFKQSDYVGRLVWRKTGDGVYTIEVVTIST